MIFSFSSLYTLYLSLLFASQRSNINLEYLLFHSSSHSLNFSFLLGLNTPNSEYFFMDWFSFYCRFLYSYSYLLDFFFYIYSFLFVSNPHIFLHTLALISFIYFWLVTQSLITRVFSFSWSLFLINISIFSPLFSLNTSLSIPPPKNTLCFLFFLGVSSSFSHAAPVHRLIDRCWESVLIWWWCRFRLKQELQKYLIHRLKRFTELFQIELAQRRKHFGEYWKIPKFLCRQLAGKINIIEKRRQRNKGLC